MLLSYLLRGVLLFLVLFKCEVNPFDDGQVIPPYRRIVGGFPQKLPKRYMVYITKAPKSKRVYDSWICGGTIVTMTSVITAAACIIDVNYMYVISGYQTYVPSKYISTNYCTKNTKKKIISTCIPKYYNFTFKRVNGWGGIDIGVAKVDSNFDFYNVAPGCSYAPKPIAVNFYEKNQLPGREAFVLGWGHLNRWRLVEELEDMNSEQLYYVSTTLQKSKVCKESFHLWPKFQVTIEKYMICASGNASMDSDGVYYDLYYSVKKEGCDDPKNARTALCRELLRNRGQTLNPSRRYTNETIRGRHFGICQNDHGGPLITHVGAEEYLIGVASVFRVLDSQTCVGPFLYTSTFCNSLFLDCVLSNDPDYVNDEHRANFTLKPNFRKKYQNVSRKAMCDLPASVKGFDIIRSQISWKNHPDGPAANEIQTEIAMNPNIKKTRNISYFKSPFRPKANGIQQRASQANKKIISNNKLQRHPIENHYVMQRNANKTLNYHQQNTNRMAY